ncbi:MAG: DUF502 domain-containing protein [Burkholderiales bacterium]|nr:DUF502 domain-containing protein [Burkholderiales bacterium]
MRKYIITGLLAWLPLAVTVWLLAYVFGLVDGLFASLVGAVQAVLPASAQPALKRLLDIPGLSVLVVLLGLFLTGVLVRNMAGNWLAGQWMAIVQRIPIVKSIYTSVKQVSDTLFSSSGQAFRQAVLVEYPRAGSWTIAFVTGRPGGEVGGLLPADSVSLYVPTTPNPTSGFMLMVPRSQVIELRMSVDEALKYIISMGVVAPPQPRPVRQAERPASLVE